MEFLEISGNFQKQNLVEMGILLKNQNKTGKKNWHRYCCHFSYKCAKVINMNSDEHKKRGMEYDKANE